MIYSNTHLSHDKRVKPSQEDTLAELDVICALAKPNDCIVLLGDFNVQLPANVRKLTDHHVCKKEGSNTANNVLDLPHAQT